MSREADAGQQTESTKEQELDFYEKYLENRRKEKREKKEEKKKKIKSSVTIDCIENSLITHCCALKKVQFSLSWCQM